MGAGRQPPSWVGEVLQSRDRARAAPTFAAEGLYLERVEYDPHWGLPRRAQAQQAIPVLP